MSMKPLSLALFAAASLVASAAHAQTTDEDVRDSAPDLPPTTDEPAEPEPDILDAPYPMRAHFAVRAGAGASFESIASSTLFGALGSVSLGADLKVMGVFGTIAGGGGKTEGGLDFYQFAVGPDLEWPIGPIRLGLRPRFGYLGIARATNTELMEAFRAGLGGLLAVDFLRDNGFVIGLEAEPRIDYASNPIYGVRLSFTVKRRMAREGDQPAPRIGAAF